MNAHRNVTLAVSMLLLLSSPGAAATLFANLPDGTASGGNCLIDVSDCVGSGIGAEDFTLAAPSTVESFSFQVSQPPTNDFSGTIVTWGIRNSVGSLPGNTVFASGTDPALATAAGTNITELLVDIPDIALGPADYWLTLQVDAPNTASPMFWKHTVNGNNLTAVSFDLGATWTSPYSSVSGNEVFAINGTAPSVIPLPASVSFLLLGLGLLGGFAGLRHRRIS